MGKKFKGGLQVIKVRLNGFIRLASAGLLAVTMVAGCTGSNNKPPAPTASTASEAATTAPGTTAPAAQTEAPKAEVTKLSVEVFDRANQNGTNPTDNYWTDWIKKEALEKLNLDVSFVSVPRTEELPQLNVLMAGGTPPDIVFTYTQSVPYNYYKQGGLADLTDLIDQYGSTIKSYLGDEVLATGQFDGRQYMVPAKRISRAMQNTFMRKDWLDALGLPIPQNMDDLYEAMKAFKEKNPGNVDNVIPYSVHRTGFVGSVQQIIEAFIDPNAMSDKDRFVLAVEQDNNALGLLYPGFKEGIRYFNRMYNDGLLDPEFVLIAQYQDVETKIMRGDVGCWGSNYEEPIRTSPGVYNQLKEEVPDAEIITLDCFVNPDTGNKVRQMYRANGIYNFVPASSKNIEGAVKYLNWLCQDDVHTYLVIGEEGINHNKDAEGIPVMINLQNDPRMMNSPNNLDYALVLNGVDLGNHEKNLKAISKSYEEQYVDWFMDAYRIATVNAVVYNPLLVPMEAEAQYIPSLNDKRHEILAAAITAKVADFDSVYDAGIQEWLSIGGQACVDEREAYWNSTH